MSNAIVIDGGARVAFGDVVRLSRERSSNPEEDGLDRFVGLEHIEPGDLKIRRWGNVCDGTTFTNVFHAGQVLFAKRRAYQRKVALADFDGVCSGDIYVLEAKSEELLPELLPFVCQTDVFFEHAVRTSAGSLSPRTNWDSLATYEFILPSLNEQRRIITALQTVEKTLERYRQAQFKLMQLTDNWLQMRLSATANQSPLGELLLRTEYGCSVYAGNQTVGTPILRIPNVLRDELDLTDLKWVQLSPEETAKYLLSPGDILIVRTNGNPAYVGRSLVVPQLKISSVFASYLIRLVADPLKARPGYIASALNSRRVRHAMRAVVRSSAGNFNINTSGIRQLRVPIPTLAEQDSIVSELQPLKATHKRLLNRAKDLIHLERLILEGLRCE
jgi:type I restriction enzyme, S subunit